MTKTTNNVTVIGLGAMGAALAHTFLRKGFAVTVWNRDSTKALPLIAAGATLTTDAATAIAASPVTVVCVSTYSILETATTALNACTLIQLSTGTPKEGRDIEKWAQGLGANCIIGAILDWPNRIGGENTTILAAGATNTFQQQEQLLRALAGNLTYMGEEAGAASALFSAVLAYLAGSWIGFCHGALIAENEGLRVDDFGALMHTLAPILGAESRQMGEVIQQDNFTHPESTVKTTGEDLHLLVQHAVEAGINSELPRFAADLFQRTIDAGYGLEEHAAVIKILRQKA